MNLGDLEGGERSFNEILAKVREKTSDREQQSKLLTEQVLKDFIQFCRSFKEKSGFLELKKSSWPRSEAVQKPMVIKKKRSRSETKEEKERGGGEEADSSEANTSSPVKLPPKKRRYPRADAIVRAAREKKRSKTWRRFGRTPVVLRELSVEMRNLIESMGGTDMRLVIQKHLYVTDLKGHHDRMTLPRNQVITKFLEEQEERELFSYGGSLPLKVIEPCLDESDLRLGEWKMRNTTSYVIRSGWHNKVVKKPANRLTEGQLIQVWSFRVQGGLRFAIIRLEDEVGEHGGFVGLEEEAGEHSGTGSSSSTQASSGNKHE